MHDEYPWLFGGKTIHDRAGIVGAAIVDQNNFKIIEQIARQRQHAFDSGNDDGEPFVRSV